MGITVGPSFTTDSGFVIAPLYISIMSFRILVTQNGDLQAAFTVNGYKSREDMEAGRAAIPLTTTQSTAETFLKPTDLSRQNLYGLAYAAIKNRWHTIGYNCEDVFEPGQPAPTEYIYDASGFNIDGFNAGGFTKNGYNAAGFDATGFNASGYDTQGFNREGWTADGFNRDGWDHEGFGRDGYNMQALDREGNPRPT